FAYQRTLNNQRLIVLNNFYGTKTTIDLPEFDGISSVIINNYSTNVPLTSLMTLEPYQSIAFLIE
ncbi:alpha,alpha-phosphotrehalase, partial [Dellaglioa sp. TMW 2.2533]|nr:alpha,alpha-phosphotrehalase [Dellaglioa carnosa]